MKKRVPFMRPIPLISFQESIGLWWNSNPYPDSPNCSLTIL